VFPEKLSMGEFMKERVGPFFCTLAALAAVGALQSVCSAEGAVSSSTSLTGDGPSENLALSPEARIKKILATPFRGGPDEHAVLFLDEHEEAIRQIGNAAVPALVRALQDESADARLKAVLCLVALGPDAAPAVENLRPLLRSRADRQAYWTIICLGEIGKESVKAVPDLLSLLKHPQGCPFYEQIGESIGRIAKESGKLPDGLAELLNDKRAGARQGALFALGECGQLAEPLVPKIIAMLRDDHVLVRIHAARAVGRIKPRPHIAIPALVKALDDPKPSVRIAAASAIGDFGKDASTAVPRLIELLGSPMSQVRYEAGAAIGRIGPAANAAIPALKEAVKDRNQPVSQAAKKALDLIRGLEPEAR
jgi:HEAT repeat protein